MKYLLQLELSNMDLTNELSSLGSLLEHERQLISEKVCFLSIALKNKVSVAIDLGLNLSWRG